MLHEDYLVRMFSQLAAAIRESILRASGKDDPEGAAELLEVALSNATEIDGSILLQLAPESFVMMLQVSQSDPLLMEYLARTLLLESVYLEEAQDYAKANFRASQAFALADTYGFELTRDSIAPDTLDQFLNARVNQDTDESH